MRNCHRTALTLSLVVALLAASAGAAYAQEVTTTTDSTTTTVPDTTTTIAPTPVVVTGFSGDGEAVVVALGVLVFAAMMLMVAGFARTSGRT